MHWDSAIVGFFSAAAGGLLVASYNARHAYRQRVEDTYVDLVGAFSELQYELISHDADRLRQALHRYSIALARARLQDRSSDRLRALKLLACAVDNALAVANRVTAQELKAMRDHAPVEAPLLHGALHAAIEEANAKLGSLMLAVRQSWTDSGQDF